MSDATVPPLPTYTVPSLSTLASLKLQWYKRPVNNYELDKETINNSIDSAFKESFCMLNVMIEEFPLSSVSSNLFNEVLENYLNNMIFTKWLYHDFMEYKSYVRDQKKRKRNNYKQNLRERLNQ